MCSTIGTKVGSGVVDNQAIIEARNALDAAVQDYVRELDDNASIVRNWWLIAETFTDGEGIGLQVAESPTMTTWLREGLLRHLVRSFYGITH